MRTAYFAIIPILFVNFGVSAASARMIKQLTVIHATVVASTCRVVVDGDGAGNNHISFATYNKGTGEDVSPQNLTLWLYEDGATVPGCSAFRVSPTAQVSFGNEGQLDERGVITRGAGDGVRIDIRAIDEAADWKGRVTINKSTIKYPSLFATEGKLRFSASPVNLEQAKAGEYRGTLSFVVSYQ